MVCHLKIIRDCSFVGSESISFCVGQCKRKGAGEVECPLTDGRMRQLTQDTHNTSNTHPGLEKEGISDLMQLAKRQQNGAAARGLDPPMTKCQR